MNFFLFLLYPLSALYWLITFLRNKFFDLHILSEFSCQKPVIAIGNITVGGTGKTPHVRFIAQQLRHKYSFAILSRGYKRATKGYVDSLQAPSPKALGDESYMYHRVFPNMLVAVCERRVRGVQKIIRKFPHVDLILLDDAYQHRHIKPACNILLIDYNRPLSKDAVFPLGRMREGAYAIERADLIIFTKCPQLSDTDKKQLLESLKYRKSQPVLFSHVEYGNPYHIVHKDEAQTETLISGKHVVLVTGIAQADALKYYLKNYAAELTHCAYADHYDYTAEDVAAITDSAQLSQADCLIITTEKDMSKLLEAGIANTDIPVYVLPITISFSENDERILMNTIAEAILKQPV